MIKFLLNDQEQQLDNIDPNTTVLDYLRDVQLRTGTKEGCASGDCGACTVVLAEPIANNKLTYKAINACITPIGNLHGKQLITVEDLKNGDKLHPVQQAMVDNHGSQCGFCTPGFVMSMFAYRKSYDKPEKDTIIEALGGNLCRCTGYRPILDAAVKMFDPALTDQFSETETQISDQLNNINHEKFAISLTNDNKQYFAPNTLDELADLMLAHPKARLVAGGTDLCLEFTQMLKEIDCLIYTGQVKELQTIELSNDTLDIGAAVTYNQAKSLLVEQYPDLHELIERLGSYQIRNQATIAGNVGNASPIGDMPPVLIALGAKLVLRKGDVRRTVSVEEYFVRYKVTLLQTSEFIERILVPVAKENFHFKVYKISKRLEDDISATCGAFNLSFGENEAGEKVVKQAFIAFGGMAEIPKRAFHCEQALINHVWNKATIKTAMAELAKDFSPISDFRASADYRLNVSKNLLQRFYLELRQSELQANNLIVRLTHHA